MLNGDDGKNVQEFSLSDINAELGHFNWSAFFIGWLWAIFNGAWQSVWPIVLLQVIFFIFSKIFLGLLFLVCIFILEVYIGIKGNEWAYYGTKKWDSLEHFRRVQRSWVGASIVISLVLNSILFILFTFSPFKNSNNYKAKDVGNAKIESNTSLNVAKNKAYPKLHGLGGINYSFTTLKPDTIEYLKTKSEYKDYFNGKKVVIYFTGADCPYSEMFNTALDPIKNNQEYVSKYSFYARSAFGSKTFETMKDANLDMDFENTCHEFCIVNTKYGQVFSIDGLGTNEASNISTIIEQLKDW